MDVREGIRLGIDMSEAICTGYLGDLTDKELLHRPAPGANHINWQVGHLILSEHGMIEGVRPGAMPPLPVGFSERYGRDRAAGDDPAAFDTKDTLLQLAKQQRQATLAALSQTGDEEFDRETGVSYAPTVGKMFSMQGSHWLMHAGQWAVVRRQLGRPPLF